MQAGETITLKKMSDGYKITYVKPCVTDKKKRMAEVNVDIAIDGAKLERNLKRVYKDVGFSEELGVARINEGGTTIMVFSSGKLIIREAKSEKEILEHAHRVVRALKG